MLDDAIHGSDAVGTSLILDKAIQKLDSPPVLVMTGMASTDGAMGVVPTLLAVLGLVVVLGLDALALRLRGVDEEDLEAEVERAADSASDATD